MCFRTIPLLYTPVNVILVACWLLPFPSLLPCLRKRHQHHAADKHKHHNPLARSYRPAPATATLHRPQSFHPSAVHFAPHSPKEATTQFTTAHSPQPYAIFSEDITCSSSISTVIWCFGAFSRERNHHSRRRKSPPTPIHTQKCKQPLECTEKRTAKRTREADPSWAPPCPHPTPHSYLPLS